MRKSTKLPLSQGFLLKEYKKMVNKMLDDCDWISYIEDFRMCGIISGICQRNGLDIDPDKLLKLYEKEIKSLKLSKKEWVEQYGDWENGVPKIISIIYKILQNNP